MSVHRGRAEVVGKRFTSYVMKIDSADSRNDQRWDRMTP
jgi:hypothetical protein